MKTTYSNCLFLVVFAAACTGTGQTAREPAQPAAEGVGTLVVEIQGLRNSDGTVNLSLFAGPEGFPQDTTAIFRSGTILIAETEEVVFRFEDLAYGEYAIALLHDENSSGAMDTGFLGVPREGFGFSNNPSIGFGAPSFESCSIRLDQPEKALRLQVLYF